MSVITETPPELRVLVVDDNVEAATTLCYLLQIAGCRTATGYGGGMGLRVAQLFQPSLLLLDLDMPGMDGCELLGKLKALPGPISNAVSVCVTGMSDAASQERCRRAGFEHFLTKPLDGEALGLLLAQARERAAAAQAGAVPPPA